MEEADKDTMMIRITCDTQSDTRLQHTTLAWLRAAEK